VANGEIYVQLSVDFADDPKLRKLARYGKDGRLARDLYVQMLCYCKRTLSDGFVPFEQVAFMVLPEPERAGMKQLRLLIDVEVCTTTEGGALVAAFLKRNKSRAEVMRTAERKKAASTKANHERWHSERPSASCPLCHPTTDPPTDPLLSVVGSDHGDSTESTEDIGHRTEDIGHRSEVIPADKPRRASRAPASYTPTEQQIVRSRRSRPTRCCLPLPRRVDEPRRRLRRHTRARRPGARQRRPATRHQPARRVDVPVTAAVLRADACCLPLDLVVTSPPYFGLRSYQDGGEHYAGQIGDEPSPAEFVDALLAVTAECVRVLKPSGSLWVNLGDKYAAAGPSGGADVRGRSLVGAGKGAARRVATPAAEGNVREKSLIGIPWRYALRCIDDLGLILRAEVIWSKPNGLPESVTDRVRRSHEQWFHFTREPRYFSAVDEIREPHGGEPHARAMRRK
jgi:hypothetical protein